MQRLMRLATIVALGTAATAAMPAAKKHVHLERSEPMADSTVATAPSVIRLWFSAAIQINVTTIRLTDSTGSAVATAAPHMGTGTRAPVAADVQGALGAGKYNVAWRTMSRDGHPVNGTFAFTVTAAAPPAHSH